MPSFHFKGKSFLQNYHHSVKFHRLNPQNGKGTTKAPSLDDNLVIHGDNLKALKALLPTHAGKVKCIYIDPPYNTGNEGWIYNDNVASPMIQKWLGEAVGKDDLTRHDKWCCMMYPRLVLLKELLQESGAIFISIEDNEVHHLRMMMDEIYGETNYIGEFIWRKKTGGGQTDNNFVTEHESILVYRKTEQFNWLDESIPQSEADFSKEDSLGKYNAVKLAKWGNTARKEDRPKMHFPIKAPDQTNVLPIAPDGNPGRWRVGKARMKLLINDDLVEWKKIQGQWIPYEKIYFKENTVKTIKERSILYELATTAESANQLTEIFGKKDIFENTKPVDLIKLFIERSSGPNDLILDSFAGSGTTGHATLALNQEDGGNRKFILVECEDYADKITAERIRRVSKGVPNAKDEALRKGLGGTFSYYELGPEIEMDKILEGKELPSYEELARYAFFTATGENWSKAKLDKKKYYIGPSSTFETFLLYESDKEKLKDLALNLDFATEINNRFPNKQKLVFAPACFMEEYSLKELGIRFAQLPFEIYRMAE